MPIRPSKAIETFPNPHTDVDYQVDLECPEFTCLCPLTGQPDFAVLHISYVPDRTCIELKSLKSYLWSYRNEKGFHENLTGQILKDLVAALDPHFIEIVGEFNVRGGIRTTVTATHGRHPLEDSAEHPHA